MIDKIIYTPANRDNYVRSLDDYELSYCTKRGWRTLGQQTAMLDSLVYRGVPKGALLLLQNHTRGKQERILVYEEESRCGSSKLLYIFVNFKSTLL